MNEIPKTRVLDLYVRARDEFQHPDPERAVLGRAYLSGFDSDYEKNGRAGLLPVSQIKAKSIGLENLFNVEKNFLAAMELDLTSFQSGDIEASLASSAGITGGATNRARYIESLTKAYQEFSDEIEFENGDPIGIRGGSGEDLGLSDGSEEELKSETKEKSAEMKSGISLTDVGVVHSNQDVLDSFRLLRAYIDKAI